MNSYAKWNDTCLKHFRVRNNSYAGTELANGSDHECIARLRAILDQKGILNKGTSLRYKEARWEDMLTDLQY